MLRSAVVCYEDRLPSLIGVKLLTLSIARHSPSLPVCIYAPENFVSAPISEWLRRHAPNASLIAAPAGAPSGWSIKPHALLDALEHYCDVAIWLDADLMVNGPIEPRFGRLANKTLAVASETGRANPARATIWGFNVVRQLDLVVNTCIVRCTRHHLPLLRKWAELTSEPAFLEAQMQTLETRNPALYSDQDLLEGIIVSDALDGEPLHVDFILHDAEIVHGPRMTFRHCFTTSTTLPLFVHAHALKPWHLPYVQWPQRRWLRYVAVELSSYVWLARHFAAETEDPMIDEWIRPRTFVGRACDLITMSHPYLRLLPIQIVERFKQRVARFGVRNTFARILDPSRPRL